MPSLLALAKACEASYKNYPELEGWSTLNYYGPRPSGFFGALFSRQLEDGRFEIILAYRGTDGVLDGDMASNHDILRGRMVRQFPDALAALRDAITRTGPNYELYITGHSLGGGLAALCSMDKWRRGKALPTVTFNAPGLTASARQLWGKTTSLYEHEIRSSGLDAYMNDYRKALHVQVEGDPIAHFGTPTMRNLLTLPNLNCSNHPNQLTPSHIHANSNRDMAAQMLYNFTQTSLCAHSIRNLVSLLEKNPRYQEPIQWS